MAKKHDHLKKSISLKHKKDDTSADKLNNIGISRAEGFFLRQETTYNTMKNIMMKKRGDGLCSASAHQEIISNNVAREDKWAEKNKNNA